MGIIVKLFLKSGKISTRTQQNGSHILITHKHPLNDDSRRYLEDIFIITRFRTFKQKRPYCVIRTTFSVKFKKIL